jgi:DNA anti-recombination protein RmuC
MVEVLSKEQVKEREKKTMATSPKKADTTQDLTKQLDDILQNLRDVIAKRNIKINDLRAEIEKLESENTELDAKINSILSDI